MVPEIKSLYSTEINAKSPSSPQVTLVFPAETSLKSSSVI